MAVLPLLNVTKCCFCFLLNIQEHCSMPECIPPLPEWNPRGQALASAARRRGSEIEVGEHWLRGTLSQQWKQSKVRGGSECHVPPGRSPFQYFQYCTLKSANIENLEGMGTKYITLYDDIFPPSDRDVRYWKFLYVDYCLTKYHGYHDYCQCICLCYEPQ